MILIKPKMNFSTMKYRKSFQFIYNFIPFFSKRKIRKKIIRSNSPIKNITIAMLYNALLHFSF